MSEEEVSMRIQRDVAYSQNLRCIPDKNVGTDGKITRRFFEVL